MRAIHMVQPQAAQIGRSVGGGGSLIGISAFPLGSRWRRPKDAKGINALLRALSMWGLGWPAPSKKAAELRRPCRLLSVAQSRSCSLAVRGYQLFQLSPCQ